MKDYISRDDVLTHGHAWLCYDVKCCDECPFSGYGANPECKLSERISSIPAADVAPVVHAEWILMVTRDDINGPERYSWNCNGCGYRRKSGESITVRMRKPKGMYCEHCGAKMDGGKQDATD